ncbi:MAG: hypothetical protein ABSA57_14250 [Candidatus Acidiferrales bacterium]|jgi:hypothetical protein
MKLALDVSFVMLCVISVLGLLGYLMDKIVEGDSSKHTHSKPRP